MIDLPANLAASGPIIMFFWVLFGSLGIPGGTISIIAAGSLARSINSLILVIGVSFAAAVLGDIAAYELARKFLFRLRNRLVNFSFFRNSEPRARRLLNKYEFSIVFFTRFALTGLCSSVSYISGFEKINRKKFYLAVFAGEFLFSVFYSIMGYAIGETFNNLISAINYVVIAIILFALLVYLIRYLVKRKRN